MAEHNCEVALRSGVETEKHPKHDCDRMFGWVNNAIKHLLLDKANIKEPTDLQMALRGYFSRNRSKDPTAPAIAALLDDSPVPKRPAK